MEHKAAVRRPKIGLTLGSGGARGIAHIGVLKVLEKYNIPIDYIAGASSGAFVGAYYSLNKEISGFEKICLGLTKKKVLSFIDPINPKKALIAGNKLKQEIRRILENKDFNDLKIPLTIVATNLENGQEVRIKKGNLADAVRASIGIPGIFYPARLNDKWLVDGGLIDATPVDVARDMGADLVIAVDLTMGSNVNFKDPTIVGTLMQSFDIMRTELTKLKIQSVRGLVLIQPTVDDKDEIDSLRFYEAKRFIKAGEEAAEKAIPEIKRKIKEFS
ncbi:MAG: patatin-like phospholipase family protein [Nanoarchaeota archaeon]|nr:patatin-like phospholipase family protein [Nanoarchaeota archaeon]